MQESPKLNKNINYLLAGWTISDRSQVIEEDTKQSDFISYTHKTYGETYGNGKERRFIDYILFISNRVGLVLIEVS